MIQKKHPRAAAHLRELCRPLMPSESMLYASCELNKEAAITALRETYNEYTPLLYALSIDAFSAIEILTACSDINFKATDFAGNNLLHLLVLCESPNILLDIIIQQIPDSRELLVELCEQHNNAGKTPLMLALERRKWMLADRLLSLYDRPPQLIGHDSLTRLIEPADDRRLPFRLRLLKTREAYALVKAALSCCCTRD